LIDNERNVDSELAVAMEEFLRAVERVDEKKAAAAHGDHPARGRFLGDHPPVRQTDCQCGKDDLLGELICLTNRGTVRLYARTRIAALVDPHDCGSSLQRNVGKDFGDLIVGKTRSRLGDWTEVHERPSL
jgi:hypothetical protein